MTNLEAKQGAIKKAYGKLFEKYKDRIDNDGFIHYKSEKVRREIELLLGDIESSHNYSIFRPKSLQGIENNNGWIKIESEADLPKENTWCFVISKISGITHGNFLIKNKDFWLIDATHYQPIEQPKPPIY